MREWESITQHGFTSKAREPVTDMDSQSRVCLGLLKDSGSLRADTPEAAGGLQQKQRLGREAPQDTERLPSTHLGLRN